MIGSPTRAACIDIGSNTTRLLVAEVVEGTLNRLEARRAFTHLGAGLAVGGALEPERVAAAAEAVAEQAQAVRELGSPPLRVVATAALRRASDSEALIAAVREQAGVEVEVLTAEDEARLVFAGAVGCLTAAPRGELAVVDVGGGSTEIAAGTAADGVERWTSVAVGSATLTEEVLQSDPPTPEQIRAGRDAAAQALAAAPPMRPAVAMAVGGSATSTGRLVGTTLDREALERALAVLVAAPSEQVAADQGLAPERVRLMPAGILLLSEAARRLSAPLRMSQGGLREGVVLELADAGRRMNG